MKVLASFSLALLYLMIVEGSDLAYDIEMSCDIDESPQTISDDSSDKLLQVWNNHTENYIKGYHGTIGIVGGSADLAGEVYFAAMSALAIGVDDVMIFCDPDTAQVLKRYSPDLSLFETMGTIEKTRNLLMLVDVVLLGPGLKKTPYNANEMVPAIINYCKAVKKSLVIDMDAHFWSKEVINLLAMFPKSGVILIVDQEVFTKIYKTLKKEGGDEKKIQLNEKKFGQNIYILRKGCINRGISTNTQASWHSLEADIGKKSFGQGQMLSGATAAFYFLANKHTEVESTEKFGSMYHVGVATYAASKLIRECSMNTYETMSHGMITSDVFASIKAALF